MYIYYDKNYNLKEFITDVKAFQSASEVNNLYVYVEDLEDDDYVNATVRYKNYGTIDEKDKQINVSNEFNFDGTEEKEIPFNREQDLLYFKYGKTYKFIKFVIPDEILAENGVVLATIRLITAKTIQPLELLTFNVYNEVVAKDVDISLSQWNYLLKRLYISGKFIKVVEDIGILNNNFEDYNDRDVIFDEAGQNFYLILEINGVKTKRLLLTRSSENSVNTIIVRNDKGKAEIETPVKDEDGRKSIVNVEYVNKVVEDLTLRSDVVDIVGTYQELQSYDTSTLTANDVIKVLQDDTHDNASTYYKWNGTSFDFVGEEGPYYTQTQADEKLDKKLDKVTDLNSYIRVYGISPAGSQKAIPTDAFPHAGYVAMYGTEGQLSSEEPTETYNVTTKKYVDGKIDYIVFSDTIFSKSSTLTQTEYNNLYAFYNKHYNKDKIPLFAIDKNGSIASVSLETNHWVDFTLFNDRVSPITLTIQVSTDTGHSRQFSYNSGYLHNILGQDSWKNDVKARIGVNNDNKLIITDGAGNQTPGQTPSVLIPPFSYSSGKYSLNGTLSALRYEAGDVVANNHLFIGSGTYYDNLVGDRYSFKTYNIDYSKATFGFGVNPSNNDWNFRVVYNAKQDVGGDSGINPSHWTYDIVFPRKSGTVALKEDLDNFEKKTVLSNVLPTDNILLDLHNYQLESAITSDFSFIMPANASDEYLSEISFTTGPTLVAFTTTSAITFTGEDCSNTHTFVPDTNKHYNIIFWKDKAGFQAVVRGY